MQVPKYTEAGHLSLIGPQSIDQLNVFPRFPHRSQNSIAINPNSRIHLHTPFIPLIVQSRSDPLCPFCPKEAELFLKQYNWHFLLRLRGILVISSGKHGIDYLTVSPRGSHSQVILYSYFTFNPGLFLLLQN